MVMAALSLTLAIGLVGYIFLERHNQGADVSAALSTPVPEASPPQVSESETPAPTPTPAPRIVESTPPPLPTASPAISVVPTLTGAAPPPTFQAAPEQSATPSDVVDLAALANTPAEWPKTVRLKDGSVVFPVIINGQSAGEIQSVPGMQVAVVKVTPDHVTVSFQGSLQAVPISSTDLIERVKASRRH